MNRRKLLKAAGAAVASTAVAAPAIAQSAPTLRWRLTTSFPKTDSTMWFSPMKIALPFICTHRGPAVGRRVGRAN